MLDNNTKKSVEDLVTSMGRQVSKINEDKEVLNSLKRTSGDPENIDHFRLVIAKMTEAEEALRLAKTRLNNLL